MTISDRGRAVLDAAVAGDPRGPGAVFSQKNYRFNAPARPETRSVGARVLSKMLMEDAEMTDMPANTFVTTIVAGLLVWALIVAAMLPY